MGGGGPGVLYLVLSSAVNLKLLLKKSIKNKQTNKQVTFKSLKIIWVFSKKKDAQSDLSFSLMYQYPAEDPRKSSCLWRVVPKEEEAVATGRAEAGGKQR